MKSHRRKYIGTMPYLIFYELWIITADIFKIVTAKYFVKGFSRITVDCSVMLLKGLWNTHICKGEEQKLIMWEILHSWQGYFWIMTFFISLICSVCFTYASIICYVFCQCVLSIYLQVFQLTILSVCMVWYLNYCFFIDVILDLYSEQQTGEHCLVTDAKINK